MAIEWTPGMENVKKGITRAIEAPADLVKGTSDVAVGLLFGDSNKMKVGTLRLSEGINAVPVGVLEVAGLNFDKYYEEYDKMIEKYEKKSNELKNEQKPCELIATNPANLALPQ